MIASPCPYPHCAQLVFARVPGTKDGLALTTVHDVAAWSFEAFREPVREWSTPLAVLGCFAIVPAWGFGEAVELVRTGGAAWLLCGAASLLATVPVLSVLRALGSALCNEARVVVDSRAALRNGGRGGMRLVPAMGAYRDYWPG